VEALQPAEEVYIADEVRSDAVGCRGHGEPRGCHDHIVEAGCAAVNLNQRDVRDGRNVAAGFRLRLLLRAIFDVQDRPCLQTQVADYPS